MSLLCTDWSDGPACCDWFTAYSACWKWHAHCYSSIFLLLDRKYKHLLLIILTVWDSMEPVGPNKLGTEPSFKRKHSVNPVLNSQRLENQSSGKLRVWGRVVASQRRCALCKCVTLWRVAIAKVGFKLIMTCLRCSELILSFEKITWSCSFGFATLQIVCIHVRYTLHERQYLKWHNRCTFKWSHLLLSMIGQLFLINLQCIFVF